MESPERLGNLNSGPMLISMWNHMSLLWDLPKAQNIRADKVVPQSPGWAETVVPNSPECAHNIVSLNSGLEDTVVPPA